MNIAELSDTLLVLPKVRVTSSAIHFKRTSYLVATITAIEIRRAGIIRKFGVLLAVVGALFIHSGFTASARVVWWEMVRDGVAMATVAVPAIVYGVSWELILTIGAARQRVMRSRDKGVITTTVAAINQAKYAQR